MSSSNEPKTKQPPKTPQRSPETKLQVENVKNPTTEDLQAFIDLESTQELIKKGTEFFKEMSFEEDDFKELVFAKTAPSNPTEEMSTARKYLDDIKEMAKGLSQEERDILTSKDDGFEDVFYALDAETQRNQAELVQEAEAQNAVLNDELTNKVDITASSGPVTLRRKEKPMRDKIQLDPENLTEEQIAKALVDQETQIQQMFYYLKSDQVRGPSYLKNSAEVISFNLEELNDMLTALEKTTINTKAYVEATQGYFQDFQKMFDQRYDALKTPSQEVQEVKKLVESLSSKFDEMQSAPSKFNEIQTPHIAQTPENSETINRSDSVSNQSLSSSVSSIDVDALSQNLKSVTNREEGKWQRNPMFDGLDDESNDDGHTRHSLTSNTSGSNASLSNTSSGSVENTHDEPNQLYSKAESRESAPTPPLDQKVEGFLKKWEALPDTDKDTAKYNAKEKKYKTPNTTLYQDGITLLEQLQGLKDEQLNAIVDKLGEAQSKALIEFDKDNKGRWSMKKSLGKRLGKALAISGANTVKTQLEGNNYSPKKVQEASGLERRNTQRSK